MTGQELLKLADSNVFRPATMDSIINEFVPSPNAFALTDAFFPFKLVDKDTIISLINHGAFGRTNPVNLGAEHRRIAIPGWEYKQFSGGHWREAVEYDEEVLQKAVDPSKPNEKWGEGLVVSALNLLDLRLNVLIEYVSSKIIIAGTYSEARHGVNYTYNAKIPPKYFKGVTSTPGWTTGGTWATASAATPVVDCIEALRAAMRYGLNPEYFVMTLKTALDFVNSAEAQAKVKASPMLIGQNNNVEFIFQTLVGKPMKIDERIYAEETIFSAVSAASDTVLDVVDATEFVAGDLITLRNSAGQEEERTISSISSNAITISAGTTYAYAIGDRVTVYKKFYPDNYFTIKGSMDARMSPNNWLSTPSLIKANNWKNPLPGRYTWQDFSTKVPYKLSIGAGISGGISVARCTWLTVRTTA